MNCTICGKIKQSGGLPFDQHIMPKSIQQMITSYLPQEQEEFLSPGEQSLRTTVVLDGNKHTVEKINEILQNIRILYPHVKNLTIKGGNGKLNFNNVNFPKNLESLDISKNNLNPYDALMMNLPQTLKRLSIGYNHNLTTQSLSYLISQVPNLTRLDLPKLDIRSDELIQLLQDLCKLQDLTLLNLAFNKLNNTSRETLNELIASLPNLRILNLFLNPIKYTGNPEYPDTKVIGASR